ncbi:MAG: hypothetical protein HY721_34470 [Planctomycetes bacterium]|nr:hypothetical protein [Planctomycetota bacterium]
MTTAARSPRTPHKPRSTRLLVAAIAPALVAAIAPALVAIALAGGRPGAAPAQAAGQAPAQASAKEPARTVVPAQPLLAGEPAGEPPYEMARAGRKPEREPLAGFDALEGWTLECEGGASGELRPSRRQRLWDSPVARVAYRGTSAASAVTLRPPAPIATPRAASAATLWAHGNTWAWAPEPGTPQVSIVLLLEDRGGAVQDLQLARVGWKEWWLVHKVIPRALREKGPLRVTGIRIAGCSNAEERELYLEDLALFEEKLEPLSFEPRPKRGVDPFPGQSPGANTGPGRLPFPTREETILPLNLAAGFTTRVSPAGREGAWRLAYEGPDGALEYEVAAGRSSWEPVEVRIGGKTVARALAGGGPVFPGEVQDARCEKAELAGGVLRATWRGRVGGSEVSVESSVRLWQKSLVVDYACRGGLATELSYGRIAGVEAPELLRIPYLNYGGHHLCVLVSRGAAPFFASVWMDWYRSNASAPYASDAIEADGVRLNGGVRYAPRTDGVRNDLFERVFVTFSQAFEETLPSIPNPPAKRGKEAGSRLWQESWGPEDYAREHERSRRLRAYGIERLTQCNHEITWRDGGESFTFRTSAAPRKGGDEALRRYVEAQRSLGWRSGLYTNYCDFAPVNEHWGLDHVMRDSAGDLVRAWPRCYSPKALYAVERDRVLAPAIQRKFGSDAAYTDVHTAVAPWERTDFDARVPGAGTFAATFYAYGELLLHDQDVYDGHCWSEGHHQWPYAGLATGNYGLTYGGLKLWEYPYLPHFDLLAMHPLSVDIGMPWTGQFFQGKDGWERPENIAASIDELIAATIAYGHIGWLVEEGHGMRQTCRSYYMLQQLQSRYALERVASIRYGAGPDTGAGVRAGAATLSSSEALLSGAWKESRLHVRYSNGLEVWVNGNRREPWSVARAGTEHALPPHGWLAAGPDDFTESSELVEGGRCDRLSSPDYVFVDGRGALRSVDGVATSGSAAVRRGKGEAGLSIIAVEGVGELLLTAPGRPFAASDVRSRIARLASAERIAAEAFAADEKALGAAPAARVEGGWRLGAVEGAVRYEVGPAGGGG